MRDVVGFTVRVDDTDDIGGAIFIRLGRGMVSDSDRKINEITNFFSPRQKNGISKKQILCYNVRYNQRVAQASAKHLKLRRLGKLNLMTWI